MTAPAQTTSIIVTKIVDHYAFQASDIQALKAQIESQLTVVYRQTIQAQLTLYSCQKSVSGPDATSTRWISEKADKDATSIVSTYSRELKNRVERLRKENPKGNRFFYMSTLDTWLASRTPRKTASISLNTLTAAREYAKDRFITENGIEGKFVFTGPPPVCKLCIRVKALGPITYKQTRLERNRLPQHVNCPHTYQQLIPKAINCADAWTG